MPLTDKGKEILAKMEKEYGAEQGERVFYASANKGTITGVHGDAEQGKLDAVVEACHKYDASYESLLRKQREELSERQEKERVQRELEKGEQQYRQGKELERIIRERQKKDSASRIDTVIGSFDKKHVVVHSKKDADVDSQIRELKKQAEVLGKKLYAAGRKTIKAEKTHPVDYRNAQEEYGQIAERLETVVAKLNKLGIKVLTGQGPDVFFDSVK